MQTSSSPLKSILIFLAGVAIIAVVAGTTYFLATQGLKSKNAQQTNRQSQSNQTFQQALTDGCKKSDNRLVIAPDALPVTVNIAMLTSRAIFCNGGTNVDYVWFQTRDLGRTYLYDKYSVELGHPGDPFFSPFAFATQFYTKDTISLSFALENGKGYTIGTEPIVVRAIKKLTYGDGETLYATSTIQAIPGNDPRLVKILNTYALPTLNPALKSVDPQKHDEYMQELKQAFFANYPHLVNPEKTQMSKLLTRLTAVSTK